MVTSGPFPPACDVITGLRRGVTGTGFTGLGDATWAEPLSTRSSLDGLLIMESILKLDIRLAAAGLGGDATLPGGMKGCGEPSVDRPVGQSPLPALPRESVLRRWRFEAGESASRSWSRFCELVVGFYGRIRARALGTKFSPKMNAFKRKQGRYIYRVNDQGE
jgi:hypothetical protein